MDIQNRKLDLIRSLISIDDVESIEFLEAYLKIKPYRLTQEELFDRAQIASEQIAAGKYKSQEEVEKESNHW